MLHIYLGTLALCMLCGQLLGESFSSHVIQFTCARDELAAAGRYHTCGRRRTCNAALASASRAASQ